ncbi:UNVERIFIED_CONTAM: hypothetical protein BEN50_19735 [Euhalothece sp. KZN 001]
MVIQGAFRGAGRTRISMVLSLISRYVIRFPIGLVLAFPLAWGITGMWLGLSISGVGAFLLGIWWFRRGDWRQSVIEQTPSTTVADRAVES